MPLQTVVNSTTEAPEPSVYDELARRGLRAYRGNMRSEPFDERGYQSQVLMQDAGEDAADSGSVGNNATAISADGIDAQTAAVFEAASAEANPDSIIEELIGLGLLGAGAYALWRRWRNGRGTGTPDVPGAGGAGTDPNVRVNDTLTRIDGELPNNADTTIDGEFTEQRAITDRRALPAPANDAQAPRSIASEIAQRHRLTDQRTQSQRDGQVEATPGAQRRMSIEQARASAERTARGQPNDVGTLPVGEDLSRYPEEDVRRANAIADELINQRLRGQRLRRNSTTGRAGPPSAPIYPPNASAPHAQQRPALVNEILRILSQNRNVVRGAVR